MTDTTTNGTNGKAGTAGTNGSSALNGGSVTATGLGATAIGSANGVLNGATANGEGATAIRSANATSAGAAATGKGSVAVGSGAKATRDITNTYAGTAVGFNANAKAGGVAIGDRAVSGDPGTAVGVLADATGVDAVAVGFKATATGANSPALGANATSTGANSIAIGDSASTAGFSNSVVIGKGVSATANNQIRVGTTTQNTLIPGTLTVDGNTTLNGPQITIGAANGSSVVTLPGLATGGDAKFVTANNNGTLSTSFFSVNQVNEALQLIDNQVASVGAMAAALSAIPAITTGNKNYACGAGTGAFGSAWAGAVGCVGKVASNVWINGALSFTPSLSTAFGSTPTVGGRLGVFFQF